MLLRLAYLGVTNAFAVLRLLPMGLKEYAYPDGPVWAGRV